MSIYQEMKNAEQKINNHYSDMYVRVTGKSQKIVDGYEFKNQVSTFISQIDDEQWFNIPFSFDPYWKKKEKICEDIQERMKKSLTY